jgi:SAM-dependent methyltransferase
MLAVARREVQDQRVSWVHARAEDLAEHVDGLVDVVVCNSAFWQMDMAAVAAAVGRVLRPGGRFVFNIGAQFLRLPTSGDTPRSTPSLFELMWAAAVLYHGFVAPRGEGRLPLSVEQVTGLVDAAGLRIERTKIVEHEVSPESARAWLSIPAFTDRSLPGLSYEQRMAALATAYERIDRGSPELSRWAIFVASRPADGSP